MAKKLTTSEKINTAKRLLSEAYEELDPATIDTRTVAEEEYFANLEDLFADLSDKLECFGTFALEAEL